MTPATAANPVTEAGRRRTFAIISHPDAGKTTLTEKFLLDAGAVAEAGAVKARSGRRTTPVEPEILRTRDPGTDPHRLIALPWTS